MSSIDTFCHPREGEDPQVDSRFSSVVPEPQTLRGFFDGIAARYDFLNQLLSFSLDDYWRRKSRDILLSGGESAVLDLGVGTGKFLQLFLKSQRWERAVGLDFSHRMLGVSRRGLAPQAEFVNGDFQALPFESESFDVVISAFTLRSVCNMKSFLGEVSRVLSVRGKAGFLCLTRPTNSFFRLLYYPYLKFYLPWIGGLVSGNSEAYRFLADSIMNFQEPDETARMMADMGFRKVSVHRFTFGIATLVAGEK